MSTWKLGIGSQIPTSQSKQTDTAGRETRVKLTRTFNDEIEANMIIPLRPTQMCWICGRAVRLDTCKTDEHGCAVHEQCYVAKIALANEYHRLAQNAVTR